MWVFGSTLLAFLVPGTRVRDTGVLQAGRAGTTSDVDKLLPTDWDLYWDDADHVEEVLWTTQLQWKMTHWYQNWAK